MARDFRAVVLYECVGFSMEGEGPECLVVGAAFIDGLYLAKLLQNPVVPL